MYVFYYTCMETACLFIACVCVWFYTETAVIWSVHVTGEGETEGRKGGGR